MRRRQGLAASETAAAPPTTTAFVADRPPMLWATLQESSPGLSHVARSQPIIVLAFYPES